MRDLIQHIMESNADTYRLNQNRRRASFGLNQDSVGYRIAQRRKKDQPKIEDKEESVTEAENPFKGADPEEVRKRINFKRSPYALEMPMSEELVSYPAGEIIRVCKLDLESLRDLALVWFDDEDPPYQWRYNDFDAGTIEMFLATKPGPKPVTEADEPEDTIFKGPPEAELTARKAAEQKRKDAELAARIQAIRTHRTPEEIKWADEENGGQLPDMCPKCFSDLRQTGISEVGDMSYNSDLYYEDGYWESGNTEHGDYNEAAYECAECGQDLDRGEDFDIYIPKKVRKSAGA